MSWDHLGRTLNSFVEERLLSPLLGTFFVSWCAWNYRFIVILFSEATVTDTFRLIETVAFPDQDAIALRGIVFPLLTTLAYVYVYPWPARLIFEAWKKTQVQLATIRRKYDDETPLSQAEARELRAARYSVEEELDTVRAQLAQLRQDYDRLRREQAEDSSPPAAVGLQLASAKGRRLPVVPKRLTSADRDVLNYFAERNGAVDTEEFLVQYAQTRQISRVNAEYIVTELIAAGVIERELDGRGSVRMKLTQAGRRELFGKTPPTSEDGSPGSQDGPSS